MKYKGISCVYKITYTGNCLPPYYIGSTYYQKIEEGYRGTPTSIKWKDKWAKELRENPHLFIVEILSFHDTREDALIAEAVEQKSQFELGNVLWVNQSYTNQQFLSNTNSAKKAALTDRKRNNISASRKKGHETRRKNGTDKTGVLKGIETKKKKGIPLGATKESAAKRKETILARGGNVGWTKESVAKGRETKEALGIFKIASEKMAANAKIKSQRENVIFLRNLIQTNNITLGQGWYKKSDIWINEKIAELSSAIFVDNN